MLPFAVVRLLLGVVGLVTTLYVMPLLDAARPTGPAPWATRFPEMLWQMWSRFDSGFYLGIAAHGYDGAETLVPGVQSNWAFFPLYPLLVRILASPFGGGEDALIIAGLVIATLSAFAAAVLLYRLTELELGERVARRAVLYLALYPMSFYLWANYPESLFLALTIGALYAARRRRWLLAGSIAAFAVLARPQGLLLLPVLGWECWASASASAAAQSTGRTFAGLRGAIDRLRLALRRPDGWKASVSLLPIPTAFGVFLVYGWLAVGQPLAFSIAERYGWGRHIANPLAVLVRSLWPIPPADPFDWNFWALNVAALVAFSVALILVRRSLPSVYLVLAILLVLMPITSGEINSLARYYAGIFPVFMALAWWTSRRDAERGSELHGLVIAGFGTLLGLGMAIFTLSIFAIA